jgi:hypothetical protein
LFIYTFDLKVFVIEIFLKNIWNKWETISCWRIRSLIACFWEGWILKIRKQWSTENIRIRGPFVELSTLEISNKSSIVLFELFVVLNAALTQEGRCQNDFTLTNHLPTEVLLALVDLFLAVLSKLFHKVFILFVVNLLFVSFGW